MTDNIEIEVIVDDSDLRETQRDVEVFEKESHAILDEVDERTEYSYQQVLNAARGAYLIGMGLMRSTGESVSYFFRAMISAAFGAASILGPLITAKGFATQDYVGAGLALVSLGSSIAAAIAAQAQQEDIARGLRGVDMALLGLQQLIGTIGFS